jgi:Mg2+-importing ATPase
MLTFGLVSSIFDYLTFGVLLLILHASPQQFQTGWFVGLSPIPALFMALLAVILVLYLFTAELAKHFFYRRSRHDLVGRTRSI